MEKGDYYTFSRKDDITLMSFEYKSNHMNHYYIIATSDEDDKEFIGKILPWDDKYNDKIIAVKDLDFYAEHKIIISIFT